MTFSAHTLQYSRHRFYIILAQQFPPFWGNRFLFSDLYAFSIHGLSKYGSKGNVYRQLTTDFFSLGSNQNVSIPYFLQYFYRKKWKYYTKSKFSLTFTVFIEVCNLINFKKKNLKHLFSQNTFGSCF